MSNRVLIAQKIIENDVMLKHIIITEKMKSYSRKMVQIILKMW